ncbi:prenyltransferase/squalene oxidase repeat-containing protein [Methanococcoides sp. LMO-2]|uniref:Prenyltransferase/squalene oxidase repeat-containing protein n=1 Tax=Methanococcoides cohabitans TaxID=3136559 RepID=A0ABU9KX00_9EURY
MEDAIKRAFAWTEVQDASGTKELARLITACRIWNVENDYSSRLVQLRSEDNWEGSIRETSRACSALAALDIGSNINSNFNIGDSLHWMASRQQDNGSWDNDVYDTTYALIALADMDVHEPNGCRWLVENYGEKWEHVGTTSLIITALIKQSDLVQTNMYPDFVRERAGWIFSERNEDGGWKFISTSNLVIQALSIAGFNKELERSGEWLLRKQNPNGSWGKGEGDITATALSLITLGFLKDNLINKRK